MESVKNRKNRKTTISRSFYMQFQPSKAGIEQRIREHPNIPAFS